MSSRRSPNCSESRARTAYPSAHPHRPHSKDPVIRIENLLSAAPRADFASRFASVPSAVRRDPYRVNLLPAEILKRFVELPWPAPKDFFIAIAGDRAIATLSATVSGANPEQGFIGFYECDLQHPLAVQASRALQTAAEAFLRNSGAKKILAPVNYNTWFQYRFLKPTDERPLYAWEPVMPPEYLQHFLDAGYVEAVPYISLAHLDYAPLIEGLSPYVERALQKGYRFRPFDAARFLDREVPIVYDITMESYEGNFLFEPIPFEAFRDLYVPVARKMDFSLCFFLLSPEGREIGFYFSFIDEQNPGHYVMKTIGLKHEARGGGLSNAMVCHGAMLARDQGATRAIQALARNDAQSRSYARYAPTQWEHDYVLVEKVL